MGLDAPWHWVILLIAAVVLFGGYKKLPEVTRSVGRSLRIFKTEMKGLTDDDAARNTATTPQAEPSASQTQAPSSTPVPSVPPVSPQAAPVSPQAAPVSPQVPPVPPQMPPSLGADTHAAVPGAEPVRPASEAPWEAPQ
jgi:sec-independent protein translocase protein TatA